MQLASHSSNLELLDAVDFVDALEPYICKANKQVTLAPRTLPALRLNPSFQAKLSYQRAKLVWYCKNPKPLSQKLEDKEVKQEVQEGEVKVKPEVQKLEDIKKQLCGYKIPWLVPACNGNDLLESGKGLFPDGMIAGLVPSEPNARFDAHAYVVSQSKATDWGFEFRGRSNTYTLNTAIKDLEAKCNGKETLEGQLCHAMLIAFSAKTKSEACAWFDDKLVRVAVVFGNA